MNPSSPYRKDFADLGATAYLNTAAEGLLLKTCAGALEVYARAKSLGAAGRDSLYAVEEDFRRKFADLLGVSPGEIAFLSNASAGINTLCSSIDWRPGDEVVINDLEFPSNVLPWLKLKSRGVKVNIVRNQNWELRDDDFARCINARTKVVSLSHVSFLGGFKADLGGIGKMAHSVGAIFCVDASQSLGRIPVPTAEVDYLVASSFKWLIGPHGAGIVYCNRALLSSFEPCFVGWRSASGIFAEDRFERYELKQTAAKLEVGMPNFPALFGMNDAAAYLLRIGIEKIESSLQPVCDYLAAELGGLGVLLMTPADYRKRAGIFSFAHPECERIARDLSSKNIQVWGRDGRVRISVHLYNDMDDIETLLTNLRPLVKN